MEVAAADFDKYLRRVSGRWSPNAAGKDIRGLTDRLRFALQTLSYVAAAGKVPAQVAQEALIKLQHWDEADMRIVRVTKRK